MGTNADPWLLAQIEAAVAPYLGRVPETDIAWMRERLAEAIATDPRAIDLVKRARPRAAVERSGETRCEPIAEAPRGKPAGRSKVG